MRESPLRSVEAFSRLRQMIFRFRLKPGEPLVERRLEELLGLSRTSVRSALTRLEREGLVYRARQRYLVSPIDAGELEEAYVYRTLLERKALRLAAQRREATCDGLDYLLEEMEIENLPADEWVRLSADFHLTPARFSGNRFLREGLEQVLPRIYRARLLEVTEARNLGHEEHREIVCLFRTGELEKAEELLEKHLNRSRDRLLSTITALRLQLAAQGVEVS